MTTISLHGAEFFAFHGFYPEEQNLGTKFIIDVDVSFEPLNQLKNDELAHTVDYEQVYNIVANEMKHTRKLIETVAQAIADEIKNRFPFVNYTSVVVKKLNPPLNGKVGYSAVAITI